MNYKGLILKNTYPNGLHNLVDTCSLNGYLVYLEYPFCRGRR